MSVQVPWFNSDRTFFLQVAKSFAKSASRALGFQYARTKFWEECLSNVSQNVIIFLFRLLLIIVPLYEVQTVIHVWRLYNTVLVVIFLDSGNML